MIKPNKQALNKLLANIILWFIFISVYAVYTAQENDIAINQDIPHSQFILLLDYKLVVFQLIAVFIMFGLFSFIVHKSNKKK